MVEPIPDEIWEAARSLRNAVNWQSNASVEPIARALMRRDKRAAEIAYRVCAETRHVTLGDKCRAAILTEGANHGN